jgi:hypothetical protein
MSENEQELQLSQFDRTQFCYLNLSCISAILALVALIAIPIWGSLFTLVFMIVTMGLLRACFTYEVNAIDDNTQASK